MSGQGFTCSLLLALSGSAFAHDEPPLFANAQYFVGDRPEAVATADFDGDGRLDIVTANLSSNDVSVLLADGFGGFRDSVSFPTREAPRGLAIGDCNEDGVPDVAVACELADGVSILLGNGDGSFGASLDYNVGTAPYGVTLADFDRDGHLDLATADSGTDSVSVCLGDGQGGFTLPTGYAGGSSPRSIVSGDFNGDGWIDIAEANEFAFLPGLSVLLNDQSGGFVPVTHHNVFGADKRSLAVGDINGDGALDLAAASGYGFVLVLGDGQGGFGPPSAYSVGVSPGSIAIGDMNDDGFDDIAGCCVPTLRVYWGDPSGVPTAGPSALIAGNPMATATGDFNQDGIEDVVTANSNYTDNVSVCLRDANGEFSSAPRYPVGMGGAGHLIAGDWNGDGLPDLATTITIPGLVRTMINDGSGGFVAGQDFQIGAYPTHLAQADFDQDGFLDIVASNQSLHFLSILRGTGQGNFVGWATLPAGGLFPVYNVIADFNADGWLDILSTNKNSHEIVVFLGRGQSGGSFGSFGTGIHSAAGVSPGFAAAGDMDGDGDLDVVVASASTDTISVLTGDGTGGFKPSQTVPVSSYPYRGAISDVNGDGRLDVLLSCAMAPQAEGRLEVLLQNSHGVLTPAASYLSGSSTGHLATGDIDGDGQFDVVIVNSLSMNVTVFLGDGVGGFPSPRSYIVGRPGNCGSDPNTIAAADFDGDGRLDLATVGACIMGMSVVVLLNRQTDAPGISICPGDGIGGVCPCGNSGTPGRGCENSSQSGGALLESAGATSLASDTLTLTSSGELSSSLTIFIQGSSFVAHKPFGDGLRCAGGTLIRLSVQAASGGVASAPQSGDLSISARSAVLGDSLSPGSIRIYQAFYRDPALGFCPAPPGNSFNISNGQQIVWTL